ncbi:NHL repeat-containing protein 2-like [Oppia nitens]|uniref:NHL repeat-containing protein 2-like n=1 Tax=Oppia nitens TaxID=1686743 RepID=UPI0023DB165F|nr:NHL repeat-containing protein 2-like [Oppia nitens]
MLDELDENDLPVSEQLFGLQLTLERQLSEDITDVRKRDLIYEYFDKILAEKVNIIDDFGIDMDWLNVEMSLSLHRHLNGLIVIMDFFTYCCINCLHILPKLTQIERHFHSEPVVVIGVHSPKFDNEKDTTNVMEAIVRYHIDHPVVNDPIAHLWSELGVQCWPTVLILGPNLQLLFTLIGETGVNQWIQLYTENAVKYFDHKNLLIKENKYKIPTKLLRNTFNKHILGFPSKVSLSPNGHLLAISNARYHNIIITTTSGLIRHKIGGNVSGFRNGSFGEALFNEPNGVTWSDNNTVFVADTENHAIRVIDLMKRFVSTLAGNGRQSDDIIGGKISCEQGLNSPWDICYDDSTTGSCLFIAMAGSHQIWVLALEDNTKILDKLYPKGMCLNFAGDGSEQNRNNRFRHKSSFAQPSGLAFDRKNKYLYVADSESSSIRCVDITTGCVTGVVGGDKNPQNLFAFGDCDGKGTDCRLQHCLGIAFDANTNLLFIADSYNHKIKKIDLLTKQCITIAGNGIKGNTSNCKLSECTFNEPNDEDLFVLSHKSINNLQQLNDFTLTVKDIDEKQFSNKTYVFKVLVKLNLVITSCGVLFQRTMKAL